MSYAQKLLQFRAKHNLTQDQLAKILGISKCMIFRYEKYMNKPTAVNCVKFENKMKEWE
ncbi:MAG: helix-turn-helix transcriptional regulator [Clostridia bacterium]|nr:helix-turn-helix transcriptional regulator [Clostridia bacterium]